MLHFHIDSYPFPLFSRQDTPFLSTLHGRLDLQEYQSTFGMFPNVPLISVSDAQRTPLPCLRWIRTIHHGLPPGLLTPLPAKPGYLAFLGRISPEKGIASAIRISVPEVVRDGVTGFIVGDERAAAKAVGKVDRLDRAQIRAEFEARFTARRMADDYLEAYEAVILQTQNGRPPG
jgi:glycosyltransferase involved in cell wall biosynthesis